MAVVIRPTLNAYEDEEHQLAIVIVASVRPKDKEHHLVDVVGPSLNLYEDEKLISYYSLRQWEGIVIYEKENFIAI